MMSNAARRASAPSSAPSLEAGVAHDFKNLLFVITAHCQRLIQSLDPEDARRRDVEAIAVAADRAVALTRQVLEAGRPSQSVSKPIDLNQLLGDIQSLLRGLTGDRVTLTWSLTEKLWPLRVNQTQLEQVVVNLVANARDAMPEGGTLHIATENRVTETGGRAREWVVLSVRDEGVGMPPAVKAKMFDPYFTTKGADGSGIGLATVKAVVQASGGWIEVESAPGKGTTISVGLPREATLLVMPAPPALPPAVERSTERRPRVLLVDDEPAVRDLLAHCLELEGFEAVVASTGREALAELESHGRAIDAVITDVNLPDVPGTVIVATARQADPACGVVLISGAAPPRPENDAVTPTSTLMKPFSLADFKRAVRQAVGRHRDTEPGASA